MHRYLIDWVPRGEKRQRCDQWCVVKRLACCIYDSEVHTIYFARWVSAQRCRDCIQCLIAMLSIQEYFRDKTTFSPSSYSADCPG
jgi:hypothetical protein